MSKESARFGSVEIPRELMGRLIGPSGVTIRKLEEDLGVKLGVQNGTVHIYAPNSSQFEVTEVAIKDACGLSIQVGFCVGGFMLVGSLSYKVHKHLGKGSKSISCINFYFFCLWNKSRGAQEGGGVS